MNHAAEVEHRSNFPDMLVQSFTKYYINGKGKELRVRMSWTALGLQSCVISCSACMKNEHKVVVDRYK